MTLAFELVGVDKSYHEGRSERRVLECIDAQAECGAIVAVYGRSGSGKSTLLHLLSGVDTADRGTITVCGERIDRMSERARTRFRRRHIGFIFQFFNLLPTLTVLENVLLRLELDSRVDSGARRDARELLDRVGLSDRERSFPDTLSGGEQQRVAVVAAMTHRPELVLADEPTGNLDQANATTVMDLIVSLLRERAGTLVVATHSDDISARADRVWMMAGGRVSER